VSASSAAVSPPPVLEYELIGRANFSFFRFGQDPIIKPHTIKPAEPYERGPKDTFLVNPVRQSNEQADSLLQCLAAVREPDSLR
jgi:hypothetical protein